MTDTSERDFREIIERLTRIETKQEHITQVQDEQAESIGKLQEIAAKGQGALGASLKWGGVVVGVSGAVYWLATHLVWRIPS